MSGCAVDGASSATLRSATALKDGRMLVYRRSVPPPLEHSFRQMDDERCVSQRFRWPRLPAVCRFNGRCAAGCRPHVHPYIEMRPNVPRKECVEMVRSEVWRLVGMSTHVCKAPIEANQRLVCASQIDCIYCLLQIVSASRPTRADKVNEPSQITMNLALTCRSPSVTPPSIAKEAPVRVCAFVFHSSCTVPAGARFAAGFWREKLFYVARSAQLQSCPRNRTPRIHRHRLRA
jgi:hypothetical protein